jgi:hypothetical protein
VCSFDWGIFWTGFGAWGAWMQAVVVGIAAIAAVRQLQSGKAAAQFTNFLVVRQQWDALGDAYRRLTGAGTVDKSRLALAYTIGEYATNPNAEDEPTIVRLLEWIVQAGILTDRHAVDPTMFYAQFSGNVITVYEIVEPYLDRFRAQGIDVDQVYALYVASDLYRSAVRGETTIGRAPWWRNLGFRQPRGPVGR